MDFSSLTPAQQQILLDGPALEPPEGVIPNFDNPPNRSAMANGIYGVCFAVGVIFVILRMYSTWYCTKKAYISDYLMILSFVFYTSFMSIIFRQVHVGYFVHQWDFRLRDVPELFHLFNLATNLFAITIMLIKAAILLEWLRIFLPKGTRNYFYWISVVLLTVDILFYSAAIIAINLTCIPHEKIWNPVVSGHCINSTPLDITSAAINFVIDVVVLILPQKVIWGLHMPFSKRLGVSAVFMMGILACFAAGYRLAVTVSYSLSKDVTYTFCTVGIWVVVETTCGLIVLCMPSTPKAFTDLGVTKLYTTLKSWATESRSRARSRDNHEGGSTSYFGQPYAKKDGDHHWQAFDSSSTALGKEPGFANAEHTGIELGERPLPRDAAILRTTQIGITTQETGNQPPSDIQAMSQRPWDLESTTENRTRQ